MGRVPLGRVVAFAGLEWRIHLRKSKTKEFDSYKFNQVPEALTFFLSGSFLMIDLDYFRGRKSFEWRECAMENFDFSRLCHFFLR